MKWTLSPWGKESHDPFLGPGRGSDRETETHADTGHTGAGIGEQRLRQRAVNFLGQTCVSGGRMKLRPRAQQNFFTCAKDSVQGSSYVRGN